MNKNDPFQILGSDKVPENKGEAVEEVSKDGDLNTRIENLIKSSRVFLFMKGNPEAPQCGFSANVISILSSLQVSYKTFDILTDMEVRQGVKDFASWPTYPQLWVDGELVGGNDIIMEMFESGSLQELLNA